MDKFELRVLLLRKFWETAEGAARVLFMSRLSRPTAFSSLLKYMEENFSE